jgi:hypothetical protein
MRIDRILASSCLAVGSVLAMELAWCPAPARAQEQVPEQSQEPTAELQSEALTPEQVLPSDPQPEAPAASQPLLPYKSPNLNPTQIPSAYVAEWGDYFVSGYVYGYDDGSSSINMDGGVSVGVGFGNARKLVAVEVDFNLESLANTNNGGTLDVRLGRQLISTHNFALQLGGGWLGVASYGTWPKEGGSPYGVLTAAWALRQKDPEFRQTLQVNLGGGGGRFQRLDAVDLVSSGLIASVGVELAPNLGISAGWAGRGLNASLSYVPLRGVPLYLSLSGANITNVDGTGRAVAFGITWGGSFRTATFP